MHTISSSWHLSDGEVRTIADALRVAAPHLRADSDAIAAFAQADNQDPRSRDNLTRLAKEFTDRAQAIETLLEDLS